MSPLRPLVALGLAALLGACGSGTDATGTGASGTTPPSSSSGTSSSTSTATSSGTTDPQDPAYPSGGRGRLVTVSGTVSAGVEKGCLLLTPDDGSPGGPWQLMGKVAGLEAGQKVTVRGARVDAVMTTCQQGRPFDVQEVVTG